MQDTAHTAQSTRATWVTVIMFAVEMLVIIAAVFVVFTRVKEASIRNTSIVVFAVMSVLLRTVSSFARSKLSRYAVASAVVLVFVLVMQLF